MRVALRHAAVVTEQQDQVIHVGEIEIDFARRIVLRGGHEVHLTPTEYGLLRFLAQHAGRVITHGQLLRSVLGVGYDDAIGSLRVHIASLRKKLEADPSQPRLLITEPGVGYRLRTGERLNGGVACNLRLVRFATQCSRSGRSRDSIPGLCGVTSCATDAVSRKSVRYILSHGRRAQPVVR